MNTTRLLPLLAVQTLASAATANPAPASDPQLAERQGAIVAGTPAEAGQFPDAAAIVYDGFIVGCGGTLIDVDLVLTARHCLESGPVTHVALATTDLDTPGPIIRVSTTWTAPGELDIAVLVLEEPAPVPPRPILTACGDADAIQVGAEAVVLGFGATEVDGTGATRTLLMGEVTVVDPTCSEPDVGCNPALPTATELVAAGASDSCQGDSGGPLYVFTHDGPRLAGVASRGIAGSPTACGQGGIYVRADAILPLVEQAFDRTLPRAPCSAAEPSHQGCSAAGRHHSSAGVLMLMMWVVLATGRASRARRPTLQQSRRRER